MRGRHGEPGPVLPGGLLQRWWLLGGHEQRRVQRVRDGGERRDGDVLGWDVHAGHRVQRWLQVELNVHQYPAHGHRSERRNGRDFGDDHGGTLQPSWYISGTVLVQYKVDVASYRLVLV